jgi:hypothetical protein
VITGLNTYANPNLIKTGVNTPRRTYPNHKRNSRVPTTKKSTTGTISLTIDEWFG